MEDGRSTFAKAPSSSPSAKASRTARMAYSSVGWKKQLGSLGQELEKQGDLPATSKPDPSRCCVQAAALAGTLPAHA